MLNLQLFGQDFPPLYGKSKEFYENKIKKNEEKIKKLQEKIKICKEEIEKSKQN